MFLLMRARIFAFAILTALAVLTPASVASASKGPSTQQIQAAVKQAARSKDLWATFNICNTRNHPNSVGIRGQMPGLGFRAQLSMEFQMKYWSARQKRFRQIKGADKSITLGSQSTGLYQDGVTFRFAPHAGFLASVVSFDWTLGSRSVAHLTRWTSKGHPNADGGDPPHYSAGRCVLH